MMKIFLLIVLLFVISCKKRADPLAHFANNNIAIKVYYPNGDSSSEVFKGSNAPMSCYVPGDIFGAQGKISSNERRIIFGVDAYDSTNTKVACIYFPAGSVNSYSTERAANPGTITFTTLKDQFAAGTFQANCLGFSDSILVTGSFSGYFIQ